MFHLCYSNHLDELAAALADELANVLPAGDPFAGAQVAVPGRQIATFLSMELARRHGIAANIEFCSLPELLSGLIEPGPGQRTVVDRLRIQLILGSRLADDELLADPDMAAVRKYLDGPAHNTSSSAEERLSRRVQLAERMSALYCEYGLHRPEMLAHWRQDLAGLRGPYAEQERWQRRLWLAAEKAMAGEAEAVGQLLGPLLHELPVGEMAMPERIILFGFATLPRAVITGLGRIATATGERTVISAYLLNPCEEFWEDTDTGDLLALHRWARPVRDTVRAMSELAGYDFTSRYRHPDDDRRALHQLQGRILSRSPSLEPVCDRLDDSIQLHSCTGVRRELEVIANRIWELMRSDPTLRFNQIAVLTVPDSWDRYRAQVSAVFDELGAIPHHLVDVPLTTSSRLVEALLRILDLPMGRYTRPELLGVLTHPTVISRYPEVDRERWVQWVDELNILHGQGAEDHAGTYIRGDLYHWEQGLARLAAGLFADPGQRYQRAYDRAEPYRAASLREDEIDSAARLAVLARSLMADTRALRGAELCLRDWAIAFDAVATTYLTPRNNSEERQLARCRQTLHDLADADVDGREMSFVEARAIANERLSELRGTRGEYLAQGVTVGPLSPARAVPYRAIFVAGVAEGAFPAPRSEDTLDLRGDRFVAGDISPRDRDQWLFLNTIQCARDWVILSYVGRDEISGETLAPSPLVFELVQMLLGPGRGPEEVAEIHPLGRHEDASGDDEPIDVIAHRRARAVALRIDAEQHCRQRGQPPPSAAVLADQLRSPGRAPLASVTRSPAADTLPRQTDVPDVVSLSAVRTFLERPVDAWAEAVLGIREGDLEDPAAREDEPFAPLRLREASLLRDVFLDTVAGARGAGRLRECYRRRFAEAAVAGEVPSGPFAAWQEERHLELLESWLSASPRLAAGDADCRIYAFGRASASAEIDHVLPPIEVEIAGRRVALTGATNAVVSGGVGTLVLTDNSGSANPYRIRALFDHVLLAAAGLINDQHAAAVLRKGKPIQMSLSPWSEAEARSYLTCLVRELYTERHDYLLPLDAIFRFVNKPELDLAAEVATAIRAMRSDRPRFGPIDDISMLAGPPDPAAIFARRYAPLFDRISDHG